MLEPHIKEAPARVWTLVADEACGDCGSEPSGNCYSEDHRESTGELRIRRIQ